MAQPPIHSSGSSKPETLLRVEDLAKSYPAFELRDVSFSVEAGTITGFIGRNGAGKSTTLKCLEGAVHPDGGTIEYFGKPYLGNEDTIKEQVGFELNSADFYRTKRLSLIASITSNFYANWSDDAYARYCKLFNLDQKKRIMDLSQGMRVKARTRTRSLSQRKTAHPR